MDNRSPPSPYETTRKGIDDYSTRYAWPPPDHYAQAVLISAYITQVAYGAHIIWRNRRGLLLPWLGALLSWGTICKYLICTRCERFDEKCDYCYGGKYASLFFKARPSREFDIYGILAESTSVSFLAGLPAIAAFHDRRALMTYLGLLALSHGILLKVCCYRCVLYSADDWKPRYCPNYKTVRALLKLAGKGPKVLGHLY